MAGLRPGAKPFAEDQRYDDEFYENSRVYYKNGMPGWRSFVTEDLEAKSIADFGCGEGDWLQGLDSVMPVWGCAYSPPNMHELRIPVSCYQQIDLSTAPISELKCGQKDVVVCLETIEHIARDFEDHVYELLFAPQPRLMVVGCASGKGVYQEDEFRVNKLGERVYGGKQWTIQIGRHHVNTQPVARVVRRMFREGWVVDKPLTEKFQSLRLAAFYRKNTRVYRRI